MDTHAAPPSKPSSDTCGEASANTPTSKTLLTNSPPATTSSNNSKPTTAPAEKPIHMQADDDAKLSSVLQEGLKNYYQSTGQNTAHKNDPRRQNTAEEKNSQTFQKTCFSHSSTHETSDMDSPQPTPSLIYCPFSSGDPLAPKPSWKKRHPILFWLIIIFLLGGVASIPGFMKLDKLLGKPHIGIVNIEGVIMAESSVIKWIDALQSDEHIKGVIVRINSPGGAVGPSQEVYAAVKQLGQVKPVIVSMGGVAASGGYYIALGGQEIFAGPSTLTGSIGVIMELPNFEHLMKTIGISQKTLATGSLKGAGSPTREMTPEEEAYFKELLNDMYIEFISTVAERRGLSLADVKKVADGRALTGRQALHAGLVDSLGGMSSAKERIRQLCGIPSTERITYIEGPESPQSFLKDLLKSTLGWEPEGNLSNRVPQFYYQ